jgi:hypothetical protein
MPAQLLEGPDMASQGSLERFRMSFDMKLSIHIMGCSADEAAADELDMLIDYCEERMGIVTPSVMMQALAEAIVGMNETQALWVEKEKMH